MIDPSYIVAWRFGALPSPRRSGQVPLRKWAEWLYWHRAFDAWVKYDHELPPATPEFSGCRAVQ